jgi:hypothetical protein
MHHTPSLFSIQMRSHKLFPGASLQPQSIRSQLGMACAPPCPTIFLLFLGLGFELRASRLQSRHSMALATPPAHSALADLEPQSSQSQPPSSWDRAGRMARVVEHLPSKQLRLQAEAMGAWLSLAIGWDGGSQHTEVPLIINIGLCLGILKWTKKFEYEIFCGSWSSLTTLHVWVNWQYIHKIL